MQCSDGRIVTDLAQCAPSNNGGGGLAPAGTTIPGTTATVSASGGGSGNTHTSKSSSNSRGHR
jgi:hypothetical protein